MSEDIDLDCQLQNATAAARLSPFCGTGSACIDVSPCDVGNIQHPRRAVIDRELLFMRERLISSHLSSRTDTGHRLRASRGATGYRRLTPHPRLANGGTPRVRRRFY